MSDWRYYETWGGPRWRVNNDETGMFFQTEKEDWANWLVSILNSNEDMIRPFDHGCAITDEGDLIRV